MATVTDYQYMARAIALARRGLYSTHPNPRVGCVLVKDNHIIGEGWHVYAGGPHAEINALGQAGTQAVGATCYVSLEPCCHHGRTPPCTDALLRAGVVRVVIAMLDPNPRVAGRGVEQLQAAGIEVESGVLADEASLLNRGFVKRMQTGRPFVRCKIGMSLDGRTAMASGESQWITSAAARQDVQRLRAESSAILTGIGTVLDDDPRLTVRKPLDGTARQPLRVILDSKLRIPAQASLLQQPGRSLVLTLPSSTRQRAGIAGAEIVGLPGTQGRLELPSVLTYLAKQHEVNEILVEAGATLTGALLEAGLIDEMICYIAPVLLGSDARGVATLPGLQVLEDKLTMTITDMRMVGADMRVTANR